MLDDDKDVNNEEIKTKLNLKAPVKDPQFLGEPTIYNSETNEYETIATKNYINKQLIVKEI